MKIYNLFYLFQLKKISNRPISLNAVVPLYSDKSSIKTFEKSTLEFKPFSGIIGDIKRRTKYYIRDWTDGMKLRTVGASFSLYFTCLAPVVAFGGIANLITEGNMGVIEFILSTGISGIFYAIFSGQPMTFLGPTGLTLAFISTLFRYSKSNLLPFLEIYSWTGIWTSLFLALSAIFNLSNLLNYCTRFTDDCFNALLSINFLYEAFLSLAGNFAGPNPNIIKALVSTNVAAVTALLTKYTATFKEKRILFNKFTRGLISSFGPSLVVVFFSYIFSQTDLKYIGLDNLSVPSIFSWKRLKLPALFTLPNHMRFLTIIPAILLTMLFYLDQNISVRAVNAFELKKGEAYHLDMLILSFIVFVLSISGLPWVCAATVQSLTHVRAMGASQSKRQSNEVAMNFTETRLSGLLTHCGILCSVLLLPLLGKIPMPVISGIFLFLGRKIMMGNILFDRIGYLFCQKDKLPPKESILFSSLKTKTVAKYVFIQSLVLGLIWYLKQSSSLSLFFPSCIGFLIFTRTFILPKLFTFKELELLDGKLEL